VTAQRLCHSENIYQQLGVQSRTLAARLATEHGLISIRSVKMMGYLPIRVGCGPPFLLPVNRPKSVVSR